MVYPFANNILINMCLKYYFELINSMEEKSLKRSFTFFWYWWIQAELNNSILLILKNGGKWIC